MPFAVLPVSLQKKGIKSVVMHSLLYRSSVLYTCNAYQVMKHFHPYVVVELLYGVKEKSFIILRFIKIIL